jgi:hypothetical protein
MYAALWSHTLLCRCDESWKGWSALNNKAFLPHDNRRFSMYSSSAMYLLSITSQRTLKNLEVNSLDFIKFTTLTTSSNTILSAFFTAIT